MKTSRMVTAAVLCFLAVVWRGVGAERYVDVNLTTGNYDGSSWENAFTNLQDAIAATGTGTNLWIAQGTYYPINGTDKTVGFRPKVGMQLYGGFTNGMTSLSQRDWLEYATILSGDIDKDGLLDADNTTHVLYLTNNVVLDGLHVMYGFSTSTDKPGAAIYGGVSATPATNVVIRNCVIAQNQPYATTLINNAGSVVSIYGYTQVSNCIFIANHNSASLSSIVHVNYTTAANTSIRNCVFLRNGPGTVIYRGTTTMTGFGVYNCTFYTNTGFQIHSRGTTANAWTLKNSIMWGNQGTITNYGTDPVVGSASYCDIQGSGGSAAWTLSSHIGDGGENIDADPRFVGGPTGSVTAAGVFDSATFRTTLTDGNRSFTDNELKSKFLTIDSPKNTNCFFILSNNSTQIVVRGKADTIGASGKTYEVLDVHLQSVLGHWRWLGDWPNDAANSPCLDKGDPAGGAAAYANEPTPNGGRLNMGAYGNTAQASKSSSEPPSPVNDLVAAPRNGEVLLTWVNPQSGSLAGVLVARNANSSPAGTPVSGSSYVVGNTLPGGGEVVYVGTGVSGTPGAASAWTNSSAVNNDTHYYYRVFAYDGANVYSTGQPADTTPSASAGSSPIYVDAQATGANNGVSWANAFTNLQAALSVAGSNTQVWIAQGTYAPGERKDSSFQPVATVALYGGFTNGMGGLAERRWLDYPAVLSGDLGVAGYAADNAYHVLKTSFSNTIDGCHIVDGNASTAADGLGGGISNSATAVKVRNCVFARNYALSAGSAIYSFHLVSGIAISNCIFAAHPAAHSIVWVSAPVNLVANGLWLWNGTTYGIYLPSAGTLVKNCTFTRNAGVQVYDYSALSNNIRNCILWGNTTSISNGRGNATGGLCVSYSDIEGSGGSAAWNLRPGFEPDQGGNIDADPLFIGGPTGTWSAAASYASGRTTLTDAGGGFGVNALRGRHLNPDTAGKYWYYIVSNSSTQIVVNGDASAIGTAGKNYEVLDAHEQSPSPCINAGDPADSYVLEPSPNGKRVNMGAYGGTAEASCSKDGGTIFRLR